jgi:hypothetical protein
VQSWLDILIESSKESEAPARYFWWAGLCAISAALKKNVYLQRGPFYKLYPNIYVAIVSAKSGLRKGIPVMTAKSLVEDLDNVRVISGCNSIEGLINELSCQKTFESGAVLSEAHGLLVSDEFESFLTENPRALTYLTALQNTHEHGKSGWKKHLKNSPLEHLKDPCLSLLIASNEALFSSVVKEKDIKGGFIARTFIVHESKRRQINSLIYDKDKLKELVEIDKDLKEKLLTRLKQISLLSGEFDLAPGVGKLYDEWYHKISDLEIDDITGTLERIGDQVLKVSMLVAISNHCELVIEKTDLETAIQEVELCAFQDVKNVSMEKSHGEINPVIEKVLKELIRVYPEDITRQNLLIKTHIEPIFLDRALETLRERGAIEEPRRDAKKKVVYRMTEATYRTYIKFQTAEKGAN